MVIRMLHYSRSVGEIAQFNKHFPQLIRMWQKETTITCEDPLYDEDCSKLPAGIADWIITSARMQKKLQPAAPIMLADATEMVEECSECTTSHLAITATPVNHGANFVLHNAATVPMPVGLKPMDHTVAKVNTRCYCCNGFEHKVRDCMTADTRRRGHAFHARAGGNRARQDSGCDRTSTCRGGPGTLTRSAAGGMNMVEAAVVEDARMNDNGDNSAVEQQVGDEEDGQSNGNWE